jgi:hypothetical protein
MAMLSWRKNVVQENIAVIPETKCELLGTPSLATSEIFSECLTAQPH